MKKSWWILRTSIFMYKFINFKNIIDTPNYCHLILFISFEGYVVSCIWATTAMTVIPKFLKRFY